MNIIYVKIKENVPYEIEYKKKTNIVSKIKGRDLLFNLYLLG